MAREQLKTLSEPMYYLLLALITPQHGYGIMQSVSELTNDRVKVGAGTLYALLNRFETEGIISQVEVNDRKKIYQITPKGAELLTEEFQRLNQMVEDGKPFFDRFNTLLPIDYVKAEQVQESMQEEKQMQTQAGEAPQEGKAVQEKKPESQPDGQREENDREKQGETQGKEEREKEEKQGFGRGFRKGIFAT